jgi:hypothetical protein
MRFCSARCRVAAHRAIKATSSPDGPPRREHDEGSRNSLMILTKRFFADVVASSVSAILAALEPCPLRLFLHTVESRRRALAEI